MKWVSLGGGISFTKDGYPLDAFMRSWRIFPNALISRCIWNRGKLLYALGYLVTQVLDIVHNEMDIAIVDAAVETHMLDLLIYRTDAKIELPSGGSHRYMVAGRTCLAGDIFCTYTFPQKLQVGSLIPFADAAGYTMVKKTGLTGSQCLHCDEAFGWSRRGRPYLYVRRLPRQLI